jgi:hypothetical protein
MDQVESCVKLALRSAAYRGRGKDNFRVGVDDLKKVVRQCERTMMQLCKNTELHRHGVHGGGDVEHYVVLVRQ